MLLIDYIDLYKYNRRMSYPYFGIAGDLNLCYLFMQELKKCHENKIYPHTRCENERQDFLECHNRQKHRTALREAQLAMVRATDVNVPLYNPADDTFVYSNGRVISNTDPVFKQYKWF